MAFTVLVPDGLELQAVFQDFNRIAEIADIEAPARCSKLTSVPSSRMSAPIACEITARNLCSNMIKKGTLRNSLQEKLLERCSELTVNGDPGKSLSRAAKLFAQAIAKLKPCGSSSFRLATGGVSESPRGLSRANLFLNIVRRKQA
jgi:hypothetical protein